MTKNHVCSVAIAVAAVCVFSVAQAATPFTVKPSPSTPVQVMNDDSTAVPVKILGDVPITGVVVSGESTEILHESFVTVDSTFPSNNPSIGPIDVSGYKSVRVVLNRGSMSCGPCAPVPAPTVFVQVGGTILNTIDKVVVSEPDTFGAFASRVYEVPGTQLRFMFAADVSAAFYVVRVAVYGRAN